MKNILGYRDYSSQRKIRETIRTSVNYSGENIETSELLCFFETSKQRTWLVATNKRIYLILDDVRREKVKVNRSLRLDSLFRENKLKLKINSEYKPLTGVVTFEEGKRGWLYSKKLFTEPDDLFYAIESTIKRVL